MDSVTPDKEVVIEGATVNSAIKKGLEALGLEQNQTMIRIEQKEGYSIFGYKEARVRISYNNKESQDTLEERKRLIFKKSFDVIYEDNQLKVYIPSAFYDKHVLTNTEERKNFLKEILETFGIEEPDEELIVKVIEDFSLHNTYVAFKEFDVTPLNEDGGAIHLLFSEDRMLCEAILFREGEITEKDILDALKANLCIRGISRKAIQNALEGKTHGYFTIASGLLAVDDQAGHFEKFFDENEQNAFSKMMELLSVDTRSVKEINITERNQLLLRIGEIIEGKDGYTVNGKKLRKKTLKDASGGLNLGPNVYVSDDGKEIFAKKSGHIVWRANENFLDVESIYIVDGNVDFSEGNIMGFVGKVLIKGDVKPKFTVMAEGDIEIHGSVEDAIIKSTKGNVFIGGAVIHKTEGYVQAKSTIQCLLTTNAMLKAENIIVEKEVMNSKLEANHSIKVTGSPGVIMGGEIAAKNLLSANTIGSENWVVTNIHVGDIKELRNRMRKLQQDISKNCARLEKLEETIQIFSVKKKKQGELESSQASFYKNAVEEVPYLKEMVESAEEEIEAIQQEIIERRNAKLEVINTIYPQVDVHIFDANYTPTNPQQYTGFHCQGGQIVLYAL